MVTPVVLTYNEDRNIGSTLSSLAWAAHVVVLDSGSTDRTHEIASSFGNVSWIARTFDNHRSQWEYAIHETGIETEYVLALDADMRSPDGFYREVESFVKNGSFAGAYIPFEYHVLGRRLLGSIYPPQLRLFRKSEVFIRQPGHSQVFEINGPIYRFRSCLIHEDRKPLDRWLSNQIKYAALEAERIQNAPRANLKNALRRAGLSPLIVGIYAYVRAGGVLNSRAARAYGAERLIFEALLARSLATGVQQSSSKSL